MDRIYKYNLEASYKPNGGRYLQNPEASYKPNGGRYLQIMSAKDLYIQNITVEEHNGHSDSFQSPKSKPNIKPNEKHKQDVKPNIEFVEEHKQDVKMIRTKPDTNRITYEEEKVALILGTTAVFTVLWMFK